MSTPVILNPFALLADASDPAGLVEVVTLLAETTFAPGSFWARRQDGSERAVDGPLIVTRSQDEGRMLTLKGMLDKAWEDTNKSLACADADIRAIPGLSPPMIEQAFARNRRARQQHWLKAISHIAASPIDPVGGARPEVVA